MPLIIEGRAPSRWEDSGKSRSVVSFDRHARRAEGIRVALINNMPDAALEDTELQFFELLDIASEDTPVYLKLYSLTGIPRTDRGQRHLNSFYFEFDDLWQSQFDAVIITGTEPHHPNLRDEPYWGLMADVFDWAERNTNSTILSCLAAHASVLHFDGIARHRLPDKQFGVFTSGQNGEHELMAHASGLWRFPHSRWNEVRGDELASAGYAILTESATAGVDLFVKKTRKSLFVHFQGHPEYGSQTLLKEYRRDIKRFLRGERETYPSMPHGYFDAAATQVLNDFRENALSDRREESMECFPDSVAGGLEATWHATATCIYSNWLHYVAARKADTPTIATFARVGSARTAAINNEIA